MQNYHGEIKEYTLEGGEISPDALRQVSSFIYCIHQIGIHTLNTVDEIQNWLDSGVSLGKLIPRPGMLLQKDYAVYKSLMESDKPDAKTIHSIRTKYFSEKPFPDKMYSFNAAEAVGTEWMRVKGKNAGTFPKRLAKHLFNNYDIKLTQRQLELIGNFASTGVVKEATTYRVSFDNDYLSKYARSYCHSSSCWWSGHGYRVSFRQMGGYAMNIHNINNISKKGRVWIIEQNGKFYLFNAYGVDIFVAAKIIAQNIGWDYSKVRINSSCFYVNNSNGVCVFNPDNDEPKSVNLETTINCCPYCHGVALDPKYKTCAVCYNKRYKTKKRVETKIIRKSRDKVIYA